MHENCRLIALVPDLSKVMEKILDSRLSKWLNKNNIIHEENGAFRTRYGTVNVNNDEDNTAFPSQTQKTRRTIGNFLRQWETN